MASRWCKIKENIKCKRYSLYQYGIGIIFFSVLYIYTQLSDKPLCLVKNLLGKSCIGCGMTRGFIAALHFDFITAFHCNILSIPLLIGIGIHMVALATDVILGTNCIDKINYFLSRKGMYILYGMLIIVRYLTSASN